MRRRSGHSRTPAVGTEHRVWFDVKLRPTTYSAMKKPRRHVTVETASRRLSAVLTRAEKLGVELRTADSVSLLRQACGAAEDRLLTGVAVLSLVVVMLLACGHLAEMSAACRDNSTNTRLQESGVYVRLKRSKTVGDDEDVQDERFTSLRHWRHLVHNRGLLIYLSAIQCNLDKNVLFVTPDREIHIQTMSWNRLPGEGREGHREDRPVVISDVEVPVDPPPWLSNVRLRRKR
ncbi:hypothetical protein J6590_006046 [Homalodisca vitripennis]|nr:hypothetical protein J6590_006046 [Homalodisca vitripennis]